LNHRVYKGADGDAGENHAHRHTLRPKWKSRIRAGKI